MSKEEFGRLVLDSTDSLYRVSRGILGNDSECEDAVWEAIGIGFANLSALRHKEYAKTWLIRILIHECYRIIRERQRRSGAEFQEWMELKPEGRRAAGQDHGMAAAPDAGKYSELYEALEALEEKYRTPIVLFYLEGYSVREIAALLQSTEGTVKSWLSRGRKHLKKKLEEG